MLSFVLGSSRGDQMNVLLSSDSSFSPLSDDITFTDTVRS